MTKYIIVTESGSDLPKEIQEKYNIYIVPMHVSMGDQTYDDGSFPVEDVYKYYDETGMLPKTSGSTPSDFTEIFREIRDKYPDSIIIHIAYSAVTTVSYNSALIASEDWENIYHIDSKNVSVGLTAIVEATAKHIVANPELKPEDVVKFVEDVRERTRFVFLPQTLVYLNAGGRVSNLVFHAANLLKLHPTIVLDNGYLISGKKYRGSFDRSIKKLINDFFSNYDIDLDTVRAGGSAGLEPAQQEIIQDALGQKGIEINQFFTTGAVISSHGGPGAVGIVGIEKKTLN